MLRISSIMLSMDENLSLKVTPLKRDLSTWPFKEALWGCDKFSITLRLLASFGLVKRGKNGCHGPGLYQKALEWLKAKFPC